MIDPEKIQQIERYFAGQLSEAEIKVFKEALEQDEALRAEFEIYELEAQSLELLKQEKLLKNMDQWLEELDEKEEKDREPTQANMWILGIISLMVVAGIYFWIYFPLGQFLAANDPDKNIDTTAVQNTVKDLEKERDSSDQIINTDSPSAPNEDLEQETEPEPVANNTEERNFEPTINGEKVIASLLQQVEDPYTASKSSGDVLPKNQDDSLYLVSLKAYYKGQYVLSLQNIESISENKNTKLNVLELQALAQLRSGQYGPAKETLVQLQEKASFPFSERVPCYIAIADLGILHENMEDLLEAIERIKGEVDTNCRRLLEKVLEEQN